MDKKQNGNGCKQICSNNLDSMLKQGTESQTKKRFNLHLTEEPPQLKEPKCIPKKVSTLS